MYLHRGRSGLPTDQDRRRTDPAVDRLHRGRPVPPIDCTNHGRDADVVADRTEHDQLPTHREPITTVSRTHRQPTATTTRTHQDSTATPPRPRRESTSTTSTTQPATSCTPRRRPCRGRPPYRIRPVSLDDGNRPTTCIARESLPAVTYATIESATEPPDESTTESPDESATEPPDEDIVDADTEAVRRTRRFALSRFPPTPSLPTP